MPTIPQTETLTARPYAYIAFTVPMSAVSKPADEGFPALFAWLGQHGIAPTGAPFFNYRRIDMADTLDIEAGVPVAANAEGDAQVRFGTLPAGTYVTTTHTGPYDELYDATAMLIGWAKERGVAWDVSGKPDGDHFACRLEIYETDPSAEPDPAKWITRLQFKTAD
ncbi:MAG: GyrI-like domain-containing protein [Alphaproteobacteria bacterium]|nr:GyrI-like domain-containing protein [Alphaproteobacteria bacterium]